ncbi:MAG: hypothetical protein GY854_03945 [Deltaproteobacteria bacterium]|nr:hypothetical protein [Deltaproteobacteria bacterium]
MPDRIQVTIVPTMLRSIKTFIKDPEPTDKFEDVLPGLNLLDGIVHISEPLRSPVKGQNCAAFFYRSFLIITGGRAPAYHKLRELEVYTPFTLEMEGGTLEVVPVKPGKFDSGDHRELKARYGKEFQGVEEVVMPGARVRVRGKAKRVNGELVLKMKEIAVLDKQAVSTGVAGDRKKRKKRKK